MTLPDGAAWKAVVAVVLTAVAEVAAKKPPGTYPTCARHSSSGDTLLHCPLCLPAKHWLYSEVFTRDQWRSFVMAT